MGESDQTHAPASRGDLCAVVVTYHPGEDLEKNLRAIIAECARVIVVDNGSGLETCRRIAAIAGVELEALETNRGIAAALNHGAHLAATRGCRWAVTFDQDSHPRPGFGAALLATRMRFPHVAVIGANLEEAALQRAHRWLRPRARWPIWFERVPCAGADLPDVTMVVTSGALTDLEVWRRLGGFDEALFIDFVDTDYCLRCRAAGLSVAVSADARLEHQLGRREKRHVGGMAFHPTHHAPLRHYYIARNRVRMIRRHGRELHWLFFEIGAAGLWFFRMLAFEQQKLAKLRAMLLGTWDGLLGRFGECPPGRRRSFTDGGA